MEGVLATEKFRCKLTPGALSTFLVTYSLYNHSLVRFVRYSLLKCNWKLHTEELHAQNCSFFEFLIQEKQFSFTFIVSCCNQELFLHTATAPSVRAAVKT